MPNKAGALKKPSNGVSTQPSGLRHMTKQRGLPKVARRDPYDIPTSPEKPRQRQRLARHLSPLRKQHKEVHVAHTQANDSPTEPPLAGDQDEAEPHNAPAEESREADASKRRSGHRPAMIDSVPAEPSVGGANRDASPQVVIPHAQGNTAARPGALFHSPDDGEGTVPDESHTTLATSLRTEHPHKRGRLRKSDNSDAPSKRTKSSEIQSSAGPSGSRLVENATNESENMADPPNSESVPARARSGERESGGLAVGEKKAVVQPIILSPSEVFPDTERAPRKDASDFDPEKQDHPNEGEEERPTVTALRKNKARRVQKARRSATQSAQALPEVEEPIHRPEAGELAEEETSAITALQKKNAKRVQTARRSAAQSSQRPSEVEELDHQGGVEELGEEPAPDDEVGIRGLLGQHTVLNRLLRPADLLESCGKLEDVDKDVAALRKICQGLVKQLNELRDRPEDTALLSDPPEELDVIRTHILNLCGRGESGPADITSSLKSRSIYAFIFPVLLRVLLALVETYQATDMPGAPEDLCVSFDHLKTITGFIKDILELGEGVKHYVRPDTRLTVVQPVKNKIVAPLAKVHHLFTRHIRAEEEGQRQRRQNRIDALRREAEERAAEQAQAETAKWEIVANKWTRLHEERYVADEPIKSPAKRRHLRQPSVESEEDHNGQRFTRLEVFRPRVGPPHALVEKVKSQAWPDEAYQALMDGLQEWASDVMVFERIFRRYCGRKQPLNPYNVTEIVVMAALMKHNFEQTFDVESEPELAWVLHIPDWTKPHTILERLGPQRSDSV